MITNAIVQAAVNCGMGMVITAICYRCRNIWVPVFIHGFIDFSAAFTNGVLKYEPIVNTISGYFPISFIIIVPYIIVVIFLLRPKKMKEILEYRQAHGAVFDRCGNDSREFEYPTDGIWYGAITHPKDALADLAGGKRSV